jgi:hypothetical protein
LGYLPLAVAQAAGYLATAGQPANEYLQPPEHPATAARLINLAAVVKDLGHPANLVSAASVTTTWARLVTSASLAATLQSVPEDGGMVATSTIPLINRSRGGEEHLSLDPWTGSGWLSLRPAIDLVVLDA